MNALAIVFVIVIVLLFFKGEKHDRKVEREQTQTCGHCGKIIPYMANECPYCHRNPGVDIRSVASVGWKGSGGMVARFAVLFMAVMVALLLLFTKGTEQISKLGIVPSNTTCELTLTDCEYTGIDNEDITVTFLSTEEDGEDVSGSFDGDGTLSLKVPNGSYRMSYASEDVLYINASEYYDFSGFKSTYDFGPIRLYYHMIELQFYDSSGAALYPEEVSLYFPDMGETVSVNIGDHYFAYLFADSTGGSVQVQADSYDTITVSYEKMTGVNTLTVVLDADGQEAAWENGSDEKQIILGLEDDEDTETDWSYIAVNQDTGETLEGGSEAGYADIQQMTEGTWEITASREGYEDQSIEVDIGDYMLYWIMFTFAE